MPSSSIFLIKEASEYRLGGEVNFCSEMNSARLTFSFSFKFSGNSMISEESFLERVSNPSKSVFLEEALKTNLSSLEQTTIFFLSCCELDI